MDGALVEWYWQGNNELNTRRKSASVTVSYPKNIHRMVQDRPLELAKRLRKLIPPAPAGTFVKSACLFAWVQKGLRHRRNRLNPYIEFSAAIIVVWKKLRSWVTLFTTPGISNLRYLWQHSLREKHQNSSPKFQYTRGDYFSLSSPYTCIYPTIIFSCLFISFHKCTPQLPTTFFKISSLRD
jgi:hypothetical protein